MATGINLNYNVNTPPISPEKWQGQLISLIGRKYRFSAFEPFSSGTLEAGVFVTGIVDSLGVTKVSKPTTVDSPILGVSLLQFQRVLTYDDALGAYIYQDNDMVSLLVEGDIVMRTEAPVSVGDPVYVRYAVHSSLTRIGALNKESVTGNYLVPGAQFLESSSAAGLVKVAI